MQNKLSYSHSKVPTKNKFMTIRATRSKRWKTMQIE